MDRRKYYSELRRLVISWSFLDRTLKLVPDFLLKKNSIIVYVSVSVYAIIEWWNTLFIKPVKDHFDQFARELEEERVSH